MRTQFSQHIYHRCLPQLLARLLITDHGNFAPTVELDVVCINSPPGSDNSSLSGWSILTMETLLWPWDLICGWSTFLKVPSQWPWSPAKSLCSFHGRSSLVVEIQSGPSQRQQTSAMVSPQGSFNMTMGTSLHPWDLSVVNLQFPQSAMRSFHIDHGGLCIHQPRRAIFVDHTHSPLITDAHVLEH